MENEISIIIIDDSESSSNVIQEIIKVISKDGTNPIYLTESVNDRKTAQLEIERRKPRFILSDHRLSGDYGLEVLRQFKHDKIIDYQVQCCIYSTDGAIVSALEPKDKIFVIKSISKPEIELVLHKMHTRLKNCNLNYLFELPVSIYLDQVLYFEGVKEGTYIHYLTSNGEFDTRLSNVKLSSKIDKILDFDFFVQFHAYKVANTMYYKEVKIDKENTADQYLITTLPNVPNKWKSRGNNSRKFNHSQLLITDRFLEGILRQMP